MEGARVDSEENCIQVSLDLHRKGSVAPLHPPASSLVWGDLAPALSAQAEPHPQPRSGLSELPNPQQVGTAPARGF